MRNTLILAALATALSTRAAVTVSNVRASQKAGTTQVEILYDLACLGEVNITLTAKNGDETIVCPSITGNTLKVTVGTNKKITWNASADWPDNASNKLVFSVTATARRPSWGDASAVEWLEVNTRWCRNFYANGAITMSDDTTGLMWVYDADANGTANWDNAKTHCTNLTYAGHSDWFLPNKDQLVAMYSQKGVFKDVQLSWYWSSTSSGNPYVVSMDNGNVSNYDNRFAVYWVWPCRSNTSGTPSAPSTSTASSGQTNVHTWEVVKTEVYTDFNGNGTPDAFEDFNGNGKPDAFEDFNGNGIPDAFEDFNGNGTPDAFEDFNGNGTPDAFEDFNGNGTPDAFEDFNGNGKPDAFEGRGTNVQYNEASGTFGAMEVTAYSNGEPGKIVNGNRVYHGSEFTLDWSAFLAAHPEASGVLYRVDFHADRRLETDLFDGYVDRNTAQSVDLSLTGNACHYIHLAPILSFNASIDRANETVVRIMRDARPPFVRSPTHPDPGQYFQVPNVNLEFIPFHLDGGSVAQFHYVWDQFPDTVPGATRSVTSDFNKAFIFQPDGTYYFHLQTEDLAGSLSQTSHFVVNIGTPQPPTAIFTVQSAVTGKSPLTVTFADQSTGVIDTRIWDFGDDSATVTNPVSPVTHVYSAPGVYSVSLFVSGTSGDDSTAQTDLITVTMPDPPSAAFSADPTTVPAGAPVRFSDMSTGQINTWSWNFGNGAGSTERNPSYSYGQPGAYTVSLTVTGYGGSNTSTRTGLIQVTPPPNDPPTVAVAANQIFLNTLGEHADLDASVSSDPDGDALMFSWRESPDNPVLGLIPVASEGLARIRLYFPKPGTYRFEVVATDGTEVSDSNPVAAGAQGETITVYVPGVTGNTYAFPSEELVRLADAEVGVFANQSDADNWRNFLDLGITDSHGEFALDSFAVNTRAADVIIRRRHGSYVATQDSRTIGSAGLTEAYGLKRGVVPEFSGRVVNAAGQGVSGVTVAVVSGSNINGNPTTTGADGSFVCADVWKGSWLLQLMHSRGAELRDVFVTDGVHPEIILMPQDGQGTVRGQITLLGTEKPLSGARVELGFGGSYSATTTVQGNFEIQNVPLGTYVCWIRKTGFEAKRILHVVVAPGDNVLNAELSYKDEGPVFYGQVVDTDSSSLVPGAFVEVMGDAGYPVRTDLADVTGFFFIRDMPQGTQSVRITAPGYRVKTFDLPVAGNDIGVMAQMVRASNWTAPKPPDGNAPVVALSASKTELPYIGDPVTLTATVQNAGRATTTYIWRESADNPQVGNNVPYGSQSMKSWVFTPAKPGIYTFEVQAKRDGVLSRNTAAVQIFVPGLAGYVCLSPSAGVYPGVGVEIRAYNSYNDANGWAGNSVASCTSVEGGKFAFQNLSKGVYWLAARDSAGEFQPYGPVKRTVGYATSLNEIEINMTKPAYSVSGQITDAAGNPVEGASVIVAPGMRSESYRTSSFADGRYELREIPRGSHPFMIFKEGYAPLAQSQSVVGNTTTMNFVLAPSAGGTTTMRGRVVCNYAGVDLPVAHAEIIVGAGIARAATDQNGDYTITNLTPGWYSGTVRKDGYKSLLLGGTSPFVFIPTTGKIQNYTLELDGPGPTISGSVINEGGTAIQDVEVVLLPLMVVRSRGQNREGTAIQVDETGAFSLAGVPDGPKILEVRRNGETIGSLTFTVQNDTQVRLTTINAAPTAADDGPYGVDEDGTLTVLAADGVLKNDTDSDGESLTAILQDDVENGTLTLHPDGSFTYKPNPHWYGTDTFTYRASDGGAESAELATVTIQVAPQPDAPSIAGATLAPAAAYADSTLTVTPFGWNDVDGDAPGYRYVWKINDTAIPLRAQGEAFLSGEFAKSDAITCEVTAWDGTLEGNTVTAGPVTILNTAPAAVGVSITPVIAHTGTPLGYVAAGWHDLDGDAEEYHVQWFRNGLPISGGTGNTLPTTEFAEGDTVHVRITPWDGEDEGPPVASPEVFIRDAANIDKDSDGDGLPDWYEAENGFINGLDDGKMDHDGDGKTTLQEFVDGTNPWGHALEPGWRLVSFSTTVTRGTTRSTGGPTNPIWWVWSDTGSTWIPCAAGDTLQPWQAAWIYVTEPCEIDIRTGDVNSR